MKTKRFYKIVVLISWIFSLILFINAPSVINVRFMTLTLLNVIICSLFFFLYQKNTYKNFFYLSITSLFIISLFITHFQISIVHIYGFEIDNKAFNNFIWGDTSKANLSLSISSIALISFYFGHVFNEKRTISKSLNIELNNKYVRTINILTFLSIIFYFLFFITSGSYKYGNYSSGDELSISNYFLNFFRILIKAALILKLYTLNLEIKKISNIKEYISFIGLPLTIMVFWHILFSTFVGDRGPIIVFCILYFGLYLVRVLNPKKSIFLIIFALIIPVLFSILGASRSRVDKSSLSSRVSSSDYESRYSGNFSQNNMPGLSTLELALSVRCLNHAVSNVPSTYDYQYGLYQLKQVLAAVPFSVGILEGANLINSKKEESSSADFITFLIQGKNPSYGDATTPVADIYLDFGPLGVVICFIIFGYWIKKIDLIIFYGGYISLFSWIALMFFWSGAIYLGRATFLYYLQSIVQVYIFIVLFNSLLLKTK
jgi:hypothetical protein